MSGLPAAGRAGAGGQGDRGGEGRRDRDQELSPIAGSEDEFHDAKHDGGGRSRRPDVEGDKKFGIETFATRMGVRNIAYLGSGLLVANYLGAIALAVRYV